MICDRRAIETAGRGAISRRLNELINDVGIPGTLSILLHRCRHLLF